jgi:hypothetical protein
MAGRRQINLMVPVLATIVAGGALFAVVASSADSTDDAPPVATTTTSAPASSLPETTTTTAPEPVPVDAIAVEPYAEAVPTSYRITYDVVENQLPREEHIIVRRPYESRVLSERDGELVSGDATSIERLWTYLPGRDGWLVLQAELHRAARDHRPLAAMATAVSLGLADEVGTGSYAGRTCRTFLTGQPLGSSGVTKAMPEESAELCIDDQGLVLHERWEIDGTLVLERTATEVAVDVEVDPAVFDPSPVVEDAEEFEALLAALAVEADEETLAALRTDIVPPEGFTLDGAVFRSAMPDRGGSASTEIVRFYSNGPELIEVAEVAAPGAVDLSSDGAVRVEIDGPETWFVLDLRASAVRTRLSESSYLEIRGTDPRQLIGLLDTLTRRPG